MQMCKISAIYVDIIKLNLLFAIDYILISYLLKVNILCYLVLGLHATEQKIEFLYISSPSFIIYIFHRCGILVTVDEWMSIHYY